MIFDESNFPDLPGAWLSLPVDQSYEAITVDEKIPIKEYKASGRLPVIDQGAKEIGGFTDDVTKQVKTELPVIVFGDHTRILKYVQSPFAAGADGIKILKPLEIYNPKLFYFFLKAIRLPDKGYARHFQYLRNSKMPLPPVVEQKRIADKLDALLARVDACRRRLDRVPALIKRFRQAVLAAATAGDLTADWREQHNIYESGNQVCLSECFHIFSGFAFKKSQYSLIGSKLLQIANVGYGFVLWEEVNFVPMDIAENEFKNFTLKNGDIVMALNRPITNGQLKVARVIPQDLPATLYQRVACMRSKIEINESYVFLSMQSPDFMKQVKDNLLGSDQPYINTSALQSLYVYLPTLNEQDEIVRRVEALFAFADRLEARYAAARAQVDQLTPSLLAKAFRGELVPQDPNDEPASALLERIRAERAGQAALFEGTPKRRRKSS